MIAVQMEVTATQVVIPMTVNANDTVVGMEVQSITELIPMEVEMEWADVDPFEGDYIVTPTTEEQSLDTSGFRMLEDVIVKGIPYHVVTNHTGGQTATIGG